MTQAYYEPLSAPLVEETTDEANSDIAQIPLADNADEFCGDDETGFYGGTEMEEKTMENKKWEKKAKKFKKACAQERSARVQAERERNEVQVQYSSDQQRIQQLERELQTLNSKCEHLESEDRIRRTAMVMAIAFQRGYGVEAFLDLAFGGSDALLARGAWQFEGGNMDQTRPHRAPSPHGYHSGCDRLPHHKDKFVEVTDDD